MVRITNVVATAHLGVPVDLNYLETEMPLALYVPKKFSGLLVRLNNPVKAHCQIYHNGKITINGGTSIAESKRIAEIFCEQVRDTGYNVHLFEYQVVNLIGSLDYGQRLKLEEISLKLNSVYCPELFCGMTVRLSDCTAVIFHSGKTNFLGAKSELELMAAEIELNVLLYFIQYP